jgi:5-methylcytosine-specific restriction endonuclease McrA
MSGLQAFRPGLPAAAVDAALRGALATLDRARECAVLWFGEVVRRELYREFGYASAHQYASEALGFSRNRTNQFLRLASELERLPRLREALADGSVGWTKAQQVARVATPRSEGAWVARAQGSSREELARAIKARRRAPAQSELGLDGAPADVLVEAPPTVLAFRLSALDLARYEVLVESLKKQGLVRPEATREEVLLVALAHLAEGGAVRRRTDATPYQVVVYECEQCKRARVVTGNGDRALTASEHAAVAENATVLAPGRKARQTVSPALRKAVLARDQHRCRAPGCGSRKFLEVHHVIPREQGGSHAAANLVTLCSRCHRFLHEHSGVPWAQGLIEKRPGSAEEPGRP